MLRELVLAIGIPLLVLAAAALTLFIAAARRLAQAAGELALVDARESGLRSKSANASGGKPGA